ncbi:FMN-binding negative transcriptional regulator [Massilia jejuensis]|uniref:FMN-binding negative transcriptional regulator n=1 Tax=Massilia jejuensis TaxID=648894 RepID=A0ABW0PKI8_9BURK
MYVPPHFDETQTDVLHELIKQYPLGMLVTHGPGGLDANHIPFEFDPRQGAMGRLIAHVARANPVWQDVADGDEVLVVFRAGDAYISPNWYPSKHETHAQVPTWNYRVVHAYGRIAIRDDERSVRAVVGRLTRTHEASQPVPWKMTDSSPEFIDGLLKAIVGVEIDVTRLVGKLKLSQNKELRDAQGVAEALKNRGNAVIGNAILDQVEVKLNNH